MTMKLFFQNIRGLKSKLYEIYLVIKRHHPDILAIQETYISSKDKLNIPGYKIFRNDRCPNPRGGGVALIVKENMDPYLVINSEILEYSSVEFTTVSVQ